jgi:bacterioferritin
MGGHPSISVRQVPESNKHHIKEILEEGLAFEREAVAEYHKLLAMAGDDVVIDQLARDMIVTEQRHIYEVEKMLRGMRS